MAAGRRSDQWGSGGAGEPARGRARAPVRRARVLVQRAAERGGMRAAHGLWAALALLLLPAGGRALRDGDCEGEWGRAAGGGGPAARGAPLPALASRSPARPAVLGAGVRSSPAAGRGAGLLPERQGQPRAAEAGAGPAGAVLPGAGKVSEVRPSAGGPGWERCSEAAGSRRRLTGSGSWRPAGEQRRSRGARGRAAGGALLSPGRRPGRPLRGGGAVAPPGSCRSLLHQGRGSAELPRESETPARADGIAASSVPAVPARRVPAGKRFRRSRVMVTGASEQKEASAVTHLDSPLPPHSTTFTSALSTGCWSIGCPLITA